MKITNEQLEKIKQLNEAIKDLDPIIKERIIDYELYELLKEDYLKLAPFVKRDVNEQILIPEVVEVNERPLEDSSVSIPTLKEFFDKKKPSTNIETVTVFGFYLEHYKKQQDFNEADISKCYFEARARKPKVIGQALRDAKNRYGYLVDGHTKGAFRLSNVGENLVLHDLPRE